VSKFVGKFRKNQNYSDDYKTMNEKKQRNEHGEIKKVLSRDLNEGYEDYDDIERLEHICKIVNTSGKY
jgi:hypothetical protein